MVSSSVICVCGLVNSLVIDVWVCVGLVGGRLVIVVWFSLCRLWLIWLSMLGVCCWSSVLIGFGRNSRISGSVVVVVIVFIVKMLC